uniref:Uncharacterized protein n=1 Tax=Populus alba TaxID=43335 RepID=A0A4U5Q842_POPAL|nr:hypothetical protein D5086_0000127700 [Populus alba]
MSSGDRPRLLVLGAEGMTGVEEGLRAKVRHVDSMIGNFHLPPSFLHWLSRPPLPWMGDRRAPFKSPSSSLRPPSLVQMGIVAKMAGGSVGSKMEVTVAERLVWWSLQMRSGEERWSSDL